VLSAAIRALTRAGDTVACAEPTFSIPALLARAHGARVATVAVDADYAVSPAALAATRARLIYLCTPNNPTGTATAGARIAALARSTEAVVLIDEAYADFAEEDNTALALERDNVLVVRTMSKAFGLAGVRVGYAIGSPALIARLERARGPYAVSAGGAAAATAALREDLAWVRERARYAVTARQRLSADLRSRGLEPAPSSANFVFVPMARAAAVAEAMQSRAVLVRAFTTLPRVSPALARTDGDALRITVGPENEMARALDALDNAMRAVTACA
jgi:histidinol-phosphate aminotransferase